MINDTLEAWATRHNVTPAALADLRAILIGAPPAPSDATGSEAAVLNAVRIEASRRGWRLWRNNVGAGKIDGQFVRWGLANESSAMNKQVKSADLIGLTDTGRFVSIECKRPGWRYTGTEREVAQARWAAMVIALGGIAGFSTGSIDDMVNKG